MILPLREPDASSSLLVAQLVQVKESRQLEEREFSGVEVYTRYHWTVPFAKLFLPFSLPMALVMPVLQPHHHSADSWGAGDYLRDFLGWLNPFEAYPGGRQHLGAERVIFRRQRVWMPAKLELESVARVVMVVECGGHLVAVGETDSEGRFQVDWRQIPPETRTTIASSEVLTVRSPDDRFSNVSRRFLMDKTTRVKWLQGEDP